MTMESLGESHDTSERELLEAQVAAKLPYLTDVQLHMVIDLIEVGEKRVSRELSGDDRDDFDNGVNP